MSTTFRRAVTATVAALTVAAGALVAPASAQAAATEPAAADPTLSITIAELTRIDLGRPRVPVQQPTPVEVGVRFGHAGGGDAAGTLTFTAPAGTTFAPDQARLPAQQRLEGRAGWEPVPTGWDLVEGARSADGRSYAYRFPGDAGSIPVGLALKWAPVLVAEGSALGDREIGFSFRSTGVSYAYALDAAAPITVVDDGPDFGTVTPVTVASTDLVRGRSTDVSFVVASSEPRTGYEVSVRLTAPAGTTFPVDATVETTWRPGRSGDWRPAPQMSLQAVAISDAGRTLVGTRASGSHGGGEQYRYTVPVATPVDAAGGADLALGYRYRGTSGQGAFQATGTAPVRVVDDASSAPITLTTPDAAGIAVGYELGRPFTFRGTGRPGAPVTVENSKGLRLGTAEVGPDGTWAWTRTLMGSYVWSIVFYQDLGEPRQSEWRLTGFGPAAPAPAPVVPVVVTQPADPRVGYVVGAPYTFTGTSRPRATVEVRNLRGLRLGSVQATAGGTWSWTRTNMGTTVWALRFVADAGLAAEQSAEVRDFGPQTGTIRVTNPTTTELVRGYEPAMPYTFRGTATPQSVVTVRNRRGLKLGEATTTAAGTWAWTRTNMGYTVWYLDFVRDEGRPGSETASVEAFAPRS
ncbi:hypothetical protein ABID92_002648 [Frigoribacterium sp. PvP120]|uniref:hypothetical protein n=1 Tax=unclassified Frigoribacterium TaxID=2627005 RepID=UPI001AE75397|nr:hypothetical protein [Frigoribacterium sp. PvP121]MBP1240560.1 hypothetical protein [Frigoribacterium sp. PvP121]